MTKTPLITLIIGAFLLNSLRPLPARAEEFILPKPGVMVHLSPEFNPAILKGIKVHPDNPFRFDFILDKGDSNLSDQAIKDESNKLIKYFLASLTIPEKDLWVNLSPYEKDRIIPESFGLTEMGRDLLAEDYMLKQITASLIYPEDEVGKKFWKRIYEEAAKKFGTTNIPVNTFNKVWIVPEKAVVYENAKAGTAYVVESKLKVMLEKDYLALEKNTVIAASHTVIPPKAGIQNQSDVNNLGSKIVREIVIPQLTTEVNEGRNFAKLRQVYQSLILATWYKKKIKDSILSQVYADKNKVAGVNIDDTQEKQRIYEQYLQAFKKGVYNYIKEEQDPVTKGLMPRKYFSGGMLIFPREIIPATPEQVSRAMIHNDRAMVVEARLDLADMAMTNNDQAMAEMLYDHKNWDEQRYAIRNAAFGAMLDGSLSNSIIKFKEGSGYVVGETKDYYIIRTASHVVEKEMDYSIYTIQGEWNEIGVAHVVLKTGPESAEEDALLTINKKDCKQTLVPIKPLINFEDSQIGVIASGFHHNGNPGIFERRFVDILNHVTLMMAQAIGGDSGSPILVWKNGQWNVVATVRASPRSRSFRPRSTLCFVMTSKTVKSMLERLGRNESINASEKAAVNEYLSDYSKRFSSLETLPLSSPAMIVKKGKSSYASVSNVQTLKVPFGYKGYSPITGLDLGVALHKTLMSFNPIKGEFDDPEALMVKYRKRLAEIKIDVSKTAEATLLLDEVKEVLLKSGIVPQRIKKDIINLGIEIIANNMEAATIDSKDKKTIHFDQTWYESLTREQRIVVIGHEIGHLWVEGYMYRNYGRTLEKVPFEIHREIEIRCDAVGLLVYKTMNLHESLEMFAALSKIHKVVRFIHELAPEFFKRRTLEDIHLPIAERGQLIETLNFLSNKQLIDLINLPNDKTIRYVKITKGGRAESEDQIEKMNPAMAVPQKTGVLI